MIDVPDRVRGRAPLASLGSGFDFPSSTPVAKNPGQLSEMAADRRAARSFRPTDSADLHLFKEIR